MSMPTTTTILRDGSLTEFTETCRSGTFGILADFAADVVKSYRSDLYNDAIFLSRLMVGTDVSIVYGVRESGTFIAVATPDNEKLALANNSNVIRVDVKIIDGRCVATVTGR